MRIAEYKQVSVQTYAETVHHEAELAENGTVIAEAYDEVVEREHPVMGMVYRDMTDDEVSAWEADAASAPEPEPTVDEQLADLSEYVDVLTEMVLGGEQ